MENINYHVHIISNDIFYVNEKDKSKCINSRLVEQCLFHGTESCKAAVMSER
jgi:hypothetical protein